MDVKAVAFERPMLCDIYSSSTLLLQEVIKVRVCDVRNCPRQWQNNCGRPLNKPVKGVIAGYRKNPDETMSPIKEQLEPCGFFESAGGWHYRTRK